MTQELACLLIGLGLLGIGVTAANQHFRTGRDADENMARFFLIAACAFLFCSLYGYISSLPSIKEVGR